jgi:hypothetical protein
MLPCDSEEKKHGDYAASFSSSRLLRKDVSLRCQPAIDAKTRCQVYPTPDIDVQYVRTLNHGGKSQMLDLSESRER